MGCFPISLSPTQWFSSTISQTFSMLTSLAELDVRLAWGNCSMNLGPLLNALFYSNTCVRDIVESPKHFCNVYNSFVAVLHWKLKNFSKLAVQFFRIVKSQDSTILFTLSVYLYELSTFFFGWPAENNYLTKEKNKQFQFQLPQRKKTRGQSAYLPCCHLTKKKC